MRELNTDRRKIWTAEDPIEITQDGLRQVQMNPRIGWTFAAAMRTFLRADPDVIMIGEMRDEETARIAVEASLTGHLVLSTLHTNSAPESITRLLEIGLDPFNFSDSLLAHPGAAPGAAPVPALPRGRSRPATTSSTRWPVTTWASAAVPTPAAPRRAARALAGRVDARPRAACGCSAAAAANAATATATSAGSASTS